MSARRAARIACVALAAGCSRRQTVLPDPRVGIVAPVGVEKR